MKSHGELYGIRPKLVKVVKLLYDGNHCALTTMGKSESNVCFASCESIVWISFNRMYGRR